MILLPIRNNLFVGGPPAWTGPPANGILTPYGINGRKTKKAGEGAS